jgi:hypothetical protein
MGKRCNYKNVSKIVVLSHTLSHTHMHMLRLYAQCVGVHVSVRAVIE